LAALQAHDPRQRVAEHAVNDHRGHKSGEAIRIPEISPQSGFGHRESVTDLVTTESFVSPCKQDLQSCFVAQIHPLACEKTHQEVAATGIKTAPCGASGGNRRQHFLKKSFCTCLRMAASGLSVVA